MTESTTNGALMYLTSANSGKPTGAYTPADALGEPKRMADFDSEHLETDDEPYKDPDVLRELYVDRGLSQVEISDLLGCADCTVSKYRRKFGIERDYQNADWLREQYHDEGLSLPKIAEKCDTDPGTVHRWMDKHDIDRRSMSEAQSSGDIEQLHDAGWLETQYVENERPTADIADELDVTNWVVGRWLERHGIEARDSVGKGGEENINWKGGYETNRGTNWPKLRARALEADDYQCQGCGRHDDDHRAEYGAGLDVHHIRPVVDFDEPADADTVDNLVPLCRDCHDEWEGVPLRPTAD